MKSILTHALAGGIVAAGLGAVVLIGQGADTVEAHRAAAKTAAGQEHLAQHFARGVPPIALWERIPLREGIEGPPQLAEAAGWLRCRVSHELETGDHTFFVASVEAADPGPAGTRPLVLHDQAYAPL